MRSQTLTAALLSFVLVACNDKMLDDVGVTTELEPNDTFAAATNIGDLGPTAMPLTLTGDIEFDDGTNTDLEDHFIVLPTFTGDILVEAVPVEVGADLRIIEEIDASTDGVLINNTGAGVAESGTIAVQNSQGKNFRLEVTGADTGYTLNVSPVAPSMASSGADQPFTVQRVVVDTETGQAVLEDVELPAMLPAGE